MVHKVKGVVARSKGAPGHPGDHPGAGSRSGRGPRGHPHLRRLPYRPALPQGGINDDFPFLLGHEAAGVVSRSAPDVTEVAPGDFVVLNWRAVCGSAAPAPRASPVLLQHPQRHPEDDA